jgi:hypothetical protein
MALRKLRESIMENFPTVNDEGNDVSGTHLLEFIDSHMEAEQKQYENNRANNLITWGKYRGYSVEELSRTEKGKSYLEWTLSQSWVIPERFGWFIDQCTALNIVKKTHIRTQLD